MEKNCLLCGVGGQGTVLASKLIAYAAMKKGQRVYTSETIGMAQRGGSVVSHVRIGETISSPMIPKKCADVILAFEPGEAVRCFPYLKEGGTVIVNSTEVQPVTASLSDDIYNKEDMFDYLKKQNAEVVIVEAGEICKACGSDKILNIVLLAAAAKRGVLGISTEELKDAIRGRVAERFQEMNMAAVDMV